MSFDKIFSLINKLNENDFGPGRAKYVGGDAKLVAVPENRDTLKVKVIGFQDYIVNGRLTVGGFDGILTWLRTQPDIIDYYYKLNDLKNYFVVYEVTKDNDLTEKQVFRFTIVERKTVPTLSPSINHVTLEELQAIQKGMGPKDLVVDPGTKVIDPKATVQQQTYGLTLPVLATAIDKNKNTVLIKFFTDAYLKIKKDPNVSSHAGLAKVKAEINSGELGKATTAFLYALNAGFGVKDWSGEEVEKNLTTALTTKISAITESKGTGFFLHPNGQSLIMEAADLASSGFDSNAFVAGFNQALGGVGGTANTGDVVVPAEGFKYDSTGRLKNAELQKFQDIMMKNLPTYAGGALKSKPAVAAFLRTKADGIYGGKTKGLIGYLKIGLTDPKYPDNDDTTIKADFVNRMLKEFNLVKENRTYIGLDGYSIVIEGFDTGAADTGTGGGGGGGGGRRVVVNQGDNTANNTKSSTKIRGIENSYEYIVQNGFWMFRPKGSNDAWKKAMTASNLATLISKFPEDGGSYIRPTTPEYMYKPENGVWKVFQGGKWVEANDTSQKELKDLYGLGTADKKSTVKSLTTDQIDKEHVEIALQIKAYFPKTYDSQSFFYPWIDSYGGDDEKGAWIGFKKACGTGEKAPLNRLKKTLAAINLMGEGPEKDRLKQNQARLSGIFTNTADGSFYYKFMYGKFYTEYSIRLTKNDGTIRIITVDTDFG
jgi:hypothetical protein